MRAVIPAGTLIRRQQFIAKLPGTAEHNATPPREAKVVKVRSATRYFRFTAIPTGHDVEVHRHLAITEQSLHRQIACEAKRAGGASGYGKMPDRHPASLLHLPAG